MNLLKKNLATISALLALVLIWCLCLFLRAHLSFVQKATVAPTEKITVSDAKEPYDFSNLFLLTTKQQQSLICGVIETQKLESDLIEYYQTDLTTYTKYTLRVTQNFTGRFASDTITVYQLGDATAFPNREKLITRQEYMMRVEPFVHGEEVIYLVSPLESTFFRIDDGDILSHQTATSKAYTRISSLASFQKEFDAYCGAQKYTKTAQSYVEEMRSVCKAIDTYDYDNEKLSFVPEPSFRALTRKTAQTLLSQMEKIVSDVTQGALTDQAALKALQDCLS